MRRFVHAAITSLALCGCAASSEDLDSRKTDGRGAGAEDSSAQPDCLETREPFEVDAVTLKTPFEAVRAMVEAEYNVPLAWESGATGIFSLRAQQPAYRWVRSRNNPAVTREEVLHCSDHLEVVAQASIFLAPRGYTKSVAQLKLQLDDETGRLRATARFTADELQGAYAGQVGSQQCFVGSHIELELDAQRGLSGSVLDTIASAACKDMTDATGISARTVATFDGAGDPQCGLPDQVALRRAASSIDCGVIEANASRETFLAAQKCVLEAAAAGAAFHAIAWMQGIDSSVGSAFVSHGGAELPEILHYDSDPTGGSGVGASLSSRRCAMLAPNTANATCVDESRYELCLVCVDADDHEKVCRGPATRQPYGL